MPINRKHFAISNISFTQRESDSYLDASQITRSLDKPFPNWTRRVAAQKILAEHEDPIRIEQRRSWIAPEFVVPLVQWTTGTAKFDFDLLDKELNKPFPTGTENPLPTSKTCTKCKIEHPTDQFISNKLKPDGLDIYCRNCDKARRTPGKVDQSENARLYYHSNKEECNRKKTERLNSNPESRQKARDANKRAAAKTKASKHTLEIAAKVEETKKVEVEVSNTLKSLGSLVLRGQNDTTYKVVCRESDGYVDVTNMCKAGGKLFANWHKRAASANFLKELSKTVESPNVGDIRFVTTPDLNSELVDSSFLVHITKGGLSTDQGTWVHPRVAINIAQWISPAFDVQVSQWVHQLLVLGCVRTTDEVSDQEIIYVQSQKQLHNRLVSEGEDDQADQIAENLQEFVGVLEAKNLKLKEENDRLSRLVSRRERIKFDQGKVVYIVMHDKFPNHYKVGIANSLTPRMSNYNTHAPADYKVIYHKYTMDNDLVELNVKRMFSKDLYMQSKEWYVMENGPEILIAEIEFWCKCYNRDLKSLIPTI
jgi:hypothetical protein